MSLRSQDELSVFTEKDGIRHNFVYGEMIQPCSTIETMMARGADYGAMNIVQTIWLESLVPLNSEVVKKALWIVARRIPQLQFCLVKRGMTYWFKRVENFEIDFDISKNDTLEVFNEMIKTTFKLWTGPLWKVRLVLDDPINTRGQNRKFSASLTFAVQHSISDAISLIMIYKELISALNQIYSGEPAVETSHYPILAITEELTNYKASFINQLITGGTKFFSTMILNFSHKSSFNGALSMPVIKKSETIVLFDHLTIDESEQMLKICRDSKITVHTLIVTIANFALLTVAQSRSALTIGPTTLSVTHCVNMRRYLDHQHKNATGCHISYLQEQTKLSLSDIHDFWNVAKKNHSTFREKLEVEMEPVKVFPLLGLAWIILPVNKYLTEKGFTNKTDCHYVTTNLGNLDSLLPLPVESGCVEITDFLRTASIPYAGSPFVLAFQTFRRRFSISMDYCTNKLTDEDARDIFNIILQYIRDIISCNRINLRNT